MPNSPPAHVRAETNRTLPCEARRCTRRRVWTSVYCKNHRDRKTLYGDPRARHIKVSQWTPFYRDIRHLFKRHTRHQVLVTAVRIMNALLDPGMEPRRRHHRDAAWLRWRELSRLRDVRRRRALAIACAVWCLLREQPVILPNDGKCLDYAMARAVLHTRELSGYGIWSRRTGRVEKRVLPPSALVVGPLGHAIREHLAPFFLHVAQALDRERDERNRQLAAAAK